MGNCQKDIMKFGKQLAIDNKIPKEGIQMYLSISNID